MSGPFYLCQYCPPSFTVGAVTADDLLDHIRRVHPEHACRIALFVFSEQLEADLCPEKHSPRPVVQSLNDSVARSSPQASSAPSTPHSAASAARAPDPPSKKRAFEHVHAPLNGAEQPRAYMIVGPQSNADDSSRAVDASATDGEFGASVLRELAKSNSVQNSESTENSRSGSTSDDDDESDSVETSRDERRKQRRERDRKLGEEISCSCGKLKHFCQDKQPSHSCTGCGDRLFKQKRVNCNCKKWNPPKGELLLKKKWFYCRNCKRHSHISCREKSAQPGDQLCVACRKLTDQYDNLFESTKTALREGTMFLEDICPNCLFNTISPRVMNKHIDSCNIPPEGKTEKHQALIRAAAKK